jgi:DNA-binding MarR family transcriptional regulator
VGNRAPQQKGGSVGDAKSGDYGRIKSHLRRGSIARPDGKAIEVLAESLSLTPSAVRSILSQLVARGEVTIEGGISRAKHISLVREVTGPRSPEGRRQWAHAKLGNGKPIPANLPDDWCSEVVTRTMTPEELQQCFPNHYPSTSPLQEGTLTMTDAVPESPEVAEQGRLDAQARRKVLQDITESFLAGGPQLSEDLKTHLKIASDLTGNAIKEGLKVLREEHTIGYDRTEYQGRQYVRLLTSEERAELIAAEEAEAARLAAETVVVYGRRLKTVEVTLGLARTACEDLLSKGPLTPDELHELLADRIERSPSVAVKYVSTLVNEGFIKREKERKFQGKTYIHLVPKGARRKAAQAAATAPAPTPVAPAPAPSSNGQEQMVMLPESVMEKLKAKLQEQAERITELEAENAALKAQAPAAVVYDVGNLSGLLDDTI